MGPTPIVPHFRTPIPHATDPTGRLEALCRLAHAAGAPEIARDALELSRRVAEGRYYVACVGQFKRGKSTLLNAVVGRAILPAGVVPVTAVTTVLRHGPAVAARIQCATGTALDIDPSTLSDWVSEEGNPGNRRGVALVEVFVPSLLLATGMCLVDTPGLGSVFAASTEITRAFLPHVDAALVVIGADPPLSGEELAMVEDLSRHVSRFVFVLNKADRLSGEDLEEARAFASRVLSRTLARNAGPIFVISAAERLSGDGTRDWAAFEQALVELSREAGAELVEQGYRRGLERIAARLLAELDQQREALLRPVAESESRVEMLRATVRDAERALADLGPLFAAEEARLTGAFAQERQAFLQHEAPAARVELRAALARLGGPRHRVREQALATTQRISRAGIDAWRASVEPRAEELYRDAARRFVGIANAFLGRTRNSEESAFRLLAGEIGAESSFRVRSRFYEHDLLSSMGRSPFAWLLDAARPAGAWRRALDRAAGAYLERLLETNSSRVAADLGARVGESRRLLEADLRSLLGDVVRGAERATQRAREARHMGMGEVNVSLARIEELRSAVSRQLVSG